MFLGSCFLSLSSCEQFLVFHQPLWMMLSSSSSTLSCEAPSAKPEEHLCVLGSVVALPWSVPAVSVFKMCPSTSQSWGLAWEGILGILVLGWALPALLFLSSETGACPSLAGAQCCRFYCRQTGCVSFVKPFTFCAAVKADNSSSLPGNVLRSVGQIVLESCTVTVVLFGFLFFLVAH